MQINQLALHKLMIAEGIDTQKQLAVLSHLSKNTISSLVHGAKPKLETLKKLSTALNCNPEDLIDKEVN